MIRTARNLTAAAALSTGAILAACGGANYGTCAPRFEGTADQFDASNNLTCIWWGNDPADPPGPATWVVDPIAGDLVALSARCSGNYPVFEMYGQQPPGTPDARTCVIRYF